VALSIVLTSCNCHDSLYLFILPNTNSTHVIGTPIPGKSSSTFCLNEFDYSTYRINEIIQYLSSVSGLFPLAECLRSPRTLYCSRCWNFLPFKDRIFRGVDTPHAICSSVADSLQCFYLLAVVNTAALNFFSIKLLG